MVPARSRHLASSVGQAHDFSENTWRRSFRRHHTVHPADATIATIGFLRQADHSLWLNLQRQAWEEDLKAISRRLL